MKQTSENSENWEKLTIPVWVEDHLNLDLPNLSLNIDLDLKFSF